MPDKINYKKEIENLLSRTMGSSMSVLASPIYGPSQPSNNRYMYTIKLYEVFSSMTGGMVHSVSFTDEDEQKCFEKAYCFIKLNSRT